jgi:multidrug efflux pump subunit AcrA (membrane-fusion protein)
MKTEANGEPIRVYVSYAREDRNWFGLDARHNLIPFLGESLEAQGVVFWSDEELRVGESFEDRIRAEIGRAHVAVLLVSQHFLNSPFIRVVELPVIQARSGQGQLVVVPIWVGPCAWKGHEFISTLRMLSGPGPLTDYLETESRWERARNGILTGLRDTIGEVRARHEQARLLSGKRLERARADTDPAVRQRAEAEVARLAAKEEETKLERRAAAASIAKAKAEAEAARAALAASAARAAADKKRQEDERLEADARPARVEYREKPSRSATGSDLRPWLSNLERRIAGRFLPSLGHVELPESRPPLSLPDDGPRAEPGGEPSVDRSQQSPEIPGQRVDLVHFSVTSSPSVQPGSSFLIDVWAHLEGQRQQVLRRARQEAKHAGVQMRSKGPVRVARGTTLTVSMRVEDLVVESPEDTILWANEIGNATFAVTVPEAVTAGARHGVARIRISGLEVAKLAFLVEVGRPSPAREALPMQERRHQTAFASYASDDSDAVLARIQGMQKVAPRLEVFYAAAELRSGEHWQERLRQEILGRDVMYLFWSEAASLSKWVEWEWRLGWQERGTDFIDPCPLVSPTRVPPPKELADELHFDDWVLAFMRKADGSSVPR